MDENTETTTATEPAAETTTQPAIPSITGLNPEYADNPSIRKFGGDVNKMAGSYLALQQAFGGNKIAVPKDENDATAWGMYDKAFAVPETAEGYALENVPEGADLTTFKQLMKENHVPAKTAQKLCDAYIADIMAQAEARAEERRKQRDGAEAELKKEWGMKFNANIQKAADFLKKNYGESEDDRREALEKYGNDPKFIRMLVNMASKVSEGELGGMTGQSTSIALTPAEARAELNAILNDVNHPYWTGARNKRDNTRWAAEHNLTPVTAAEHRAAVARVEELRRMAGG